MRHRIRTSDSARRRLFAVPVLTAALSSFLAAATPATAAAATPAQPTSPKVTCTSAKDGLADRLSKDLGQVLGSHTSGHTSFALYDRTSDTRCAYDADRQYDSASVVKVVVLGTLLRQAQDERRALTADEKKLAEKMITRSDNDATTTLWKRAGLGRINGFLRLAGMHNTVPDTEGYWGLTQINAADQLTLLRLLTSENSVLGGASRAYALDLMSRVVPEQRWGVPAGAPAGAKVHVKNGWLQRSSGGWRVHSVGAVTGGGHDYGLVVLTADHPGMDAGVRTIEDLARTLHKDLNGTARPAREARARVLPHTSDGSLVPETGR
ncbi:serine hydrolase [Streptomyces sp. NPDC039022]|uniref:serine hydrolase n=1 Tax=unclassified Streptomyces TaxID=2593676 RepID=UPI0033F86BFC